MLPTILFMPGPLRLFWTTGVFYLWELRDLYRFVIVAPAEYRGNAQFQKIVEVCAVEKVVFLPSGGPLRRHFGYKKLFQNITQQYFPALLLLHNRNYSENMYAIHCARRVNPKCLLVVFQNGRWLIDWAATRKLLIDYATQQLRSRWGLPYAIAAMLVRLRRTLNNFIDHKLIPTVLTGGAFLPLEDVRAVWPISTNISKYARSPERELDFTIAYNRCEIDAQHRMGLPAVTHVNHPVRFAGSAVLEILYGKISSKNEILVLPTMGFTSSLVSDSQPTEDLVIERWIAALKILQERHPGFTLAIKLHPLAFEDALWSKGINRLQQALPDLVVYPVQIPVEKLILAASVIVSDVSTTLTWALHIGKKVVVSLDVFGYGGGDDMRHYAGVAYVNSLQALYEIELIVPEMSSTGRRVREFFENLPIQIIS